MPDLVKVARSQVNKDVDVLLVSYDLQLPKADREAMPARVAKFVGNRGWGFPVVIWGDSDVESVNERFDLPGAIPVTLAFDKDGREVGRCEGEGGAEEFAELFAKVRAR
ncbi:MAG: hypothetical protein HUU28_12050 [Planctomycetaceae bacterium]|jgi:hypothetical protein|nr:hypothetical protein [Planctomycetaceae bacterium]